MVLQSGLALCAAGLVVAVTAGTPGVVMMLAGIALTLAGAFLPARSRAVTSPASHLDEIAPVWQFGERHTRQIAAPVDRVYAAVRAVEAHEIRGFETLTWLRRGGRSLPPNILHAPRGLPLIDVAVRGGFVILAEEPLREVVLGLVVMGGQGLPSPLTTDAFQQLGGPGVAKAAINFRLEARGEQGTQVTTETRVHATDPNSRRRFAVYWRIIQPGSAFLRRMWLRAVDARATGRGPT